LTRNLAAGGKVKSGLHVAVGFVVVTTVRENGMSLLMAGRTYHVATRVKEP
jgi:hypothetical protein